MDLLFAHRTIIELTANNYSCCHQLFVRHFSLKISHNKGLACLNSLLVHLPASLQSCSFPELRYRQQRLNLRFLLFPCFAAYNICQLAYLTSQTSHLIFLIKGRQGSCLGIQGKFCLLICHRHIQLNGGQLFRQYGLLLIVPQPFLQSLAGNLLNMKQYLLHRAIGRNQLHGSFWPYLGHTGNIIGIIPHQPLQINKLNRGQALIFLLKFGHII